MAVDVERVFFFGFLRAAGEEDDVVICYSGELTERLRSRIIAVCLGAIVFERASDVNAFGPSADRSAARSGRCSSV